MSTVPSPRHLVTSLLASIPRPSDSESGLANPLHDTPEAKEIFLTIHVLFQNELLPALDLLDRRLVTRLRISEPGRNTSRGPSDSETVHHGDESDSTGGSKLQRRGESGEKVREGDSTEGTGGPAPACIYYVRSAQQQTSRSNNSRYRNAAYEHTTYYEVRLEAWSCSCPAFAFSAFPSILPDAEDGASRNAHDETSANPDWRFGGLTQGSDMPVCKHLLACALAAHGNAVSHMVEERAISAEEMAGWAAGWGD
jgi:hypothetical protein